MNGYIARLIARDNGTTLSETNIARTDSPAPLQAGAASETSGINETALFDPFEAADDSDDVPAPARSLPVHPQRDRPVIQSLTADAHDTAPQDTPRSVPPPPAEYRVIDTQRESNAPAAAWDEPAPREVLSSPPAPVPSLTLAQREAAPFLSAPEPTQAAHSPTNTPDAANTEHAPPIMPDTASSSPWTFAELLAPYLEQFAARTDDPRVEHVDNDEDAHTYPRDKGETHPVMTMQPDDSAAAFMPPAQVDAPIISIGDIVVEITPPRPPAPPARPAAPAVPVLRAGVRSKRGFGMGQM